MCDQNSVKRVYVSNPNNPMTAIPSNIGMDSAGNYVAMGPTMNVQKLVGGCSRDGESVVSAAIYDKISKAVSNGGGSAAIVAAENQNSTPTPVRAEVPNKKGGRIQMYQITIDNSTNDEEARIIIGDYAETYALSNTVPALTVDTVISGTFGPASLSQFNKRSGLIPKRVTTVRYDASNESFFAQASVSYFSTGPLNTNHSVSQINLAALVDNTQFNAKIQKDTNNYLFNASTGLDLYVPAGIKVTLTFEIQSEGQGSLMQLVEA